MFHSFKNRVREIRRAEDTVKRRWLAVLSSFSAAIIIALWLAYFTSSLPSTPEEPISEAVTSGVTEETTGGGSSVFSVLGRGFAEIRNSAAGRWNAMKETLGPRFDSLMESIGRGREISVPGENPEFTPN